MKVFVIGGTQFIGRFLVQELLGRGHDVTVFHRGKTNQGLFSGVTEVLGDRNEGFEGIGDSSWDVVVDTCAYYPSQVRSAISAFADRAAHYVFVSTISVYDLEQEGSIPEDGLLRSPMFDDADDLSNETYGPMKVACEQILDAEWGGPLTHIRPGVVLGPHDPTERFPYWPLRYSMGGRVLVPDCFGEWITGIDVRDLAAFTVKAIEDGLTGAFTVDNDGSTFGDLVAACEPLAPGGTETVRADPDKLNAFAKEWQDLPLWTRGRMSVSAKKAVAHGLTYRPLSVTAKDTLDWVVSEGKQLPLKAGWDLEREAEALRQLGL